MFVQEVLFIFFIKYSVDYTMEIGQDFLDILLLYTCIELYSTTE